MENNFTRSMDTSIDKAVAFLRQAQAKLVKGDIHGAQARIVFAERAIADFMEESIACPKTEMGYIRP